MRRFADHPKRRPTVVTGASSGIGAATALHLGTAGYPVVLGARRVDRCDALAGQIRTRGGEAYAAGLDLSDRSSIEAFVKEANTLVGEIDVAVLAAGQSRPDREVGAFESVIEVNVVGTQHLVSALLAGMIERAHGDVVFVGSEVVRHPRPGTASYVASKWAIEGYARTLQMELEGTGVRASIVQPGQTDTEMGHDWDPDVTTRILESWVRWGIARHSNFLKPEAVASAIGQVIAVPPGTHLTLVEVEPEAPIRQPRKDDDDC